MKKWGMVGLVIHLVLGIYFINSAFSFVTMPGLILEIEKWIIFAGGALIILAGMTHLVRKGRRERREF
jgi:hypothetical protein